MDSGFASRLGLLRNETIEALDQIEITILGLEEELADFPDRICLDVAGENVQVSAAEASLELDSSAWSDDSIINAGREIFSGPQDEALLYSFEGDEDNCGWDTGNDSIYKGLRIWVLDAQGSEDLIALGEPGIGLVYRGPSICSYS